MNPHLRHIRSTLLLLLCLLPAHSHAQPGRLLQHVEANVEASATGATGSYAPLWLSSNRYGLSSVEDASAYERAGVFRPIEADSLRRWRVGYGLDMALMQNAASRFVVQQAWAEVAFQHVKLMFGAKEIPPDLKNPQLSSGGLSIGMNARPIPQGRLEVNDVSFPGTNGWWKWSGRLAYGWMTDNSWIAGHHAENARYTRNVLYHEKALYWKFGREDIFPLDFVIGIQMAAQFGGTSYNVTGRNHTLATIHHDSGLGAFWDALWARGSDETDGTEHNTAGNHLGSYNLALTYHGPGWGVRAYFERYFEDQSMLTLQYGISDHLLGVEIHLPSNPFVSHVVIEHLATTNQSGAVYHDQTATLPEKMNGRDNYYNHLLYTGWQHWGMSPGHPFLTSPIYSSTKAYDLNGQITFMNNRVRAWHVGIDGNPTDELYYRLLMSYTRNWGTYDSPFTDVLRQTYFLLEGQYAPRWARGVNGRLGIGWDQGHLLGNSLGAQFTLSKRF